MAASPETGMGSHAGVLNRSEQRRATTKIARGSGPRNDIQPRRSEVPKIPPITEGIAQAEKPRIALPPASLAQILGTKKRMLMNPGRKIAIVATIAPANPAAL